ncbi:hypothetical protein [uncultured Rossellomorea sp.]|uniref:tubby C-terminal domain-like protein n=1 Tax=uncultured Rossellomorea sp. TaxID=2837549 RepID=UPI00262B9D52|nr:hypothetical protein [uncultured Rossellomorea sp.]
MRTYKFRPPMMNRSTKTFAITDDSGKKVGEIERYFNFKGQNVLSTFINMSNVKVRSVLGETSLDFKEKSLLKNLLFNKWDVNYKKDGRLHHFEIRDKTKIKTHQLFLYTFLGRNMQVKSKVMDRTTRFYKEQSGHLKIVAEVSYDTLIPPYTYTINLHDDSIHYCEIAGVYYLMHINSSD